MNMQYGLSLWNYWHYVYVSPQDEAVREIVRHGIVGEGLGGRDRADQV